jgi:5-hydroxyisourate hydrolase
MLGPMSASPNSSPDRTHVSTHVLDTALGRPAAGVDVVHTTPAGTVHTATTDDDGRAAALGPLTAGPHTLRFATGDYHARTGQQAFFPEVAITVVADPAAGHLHVPLLLSPFAYSTYRGS